MFTEENTSILIVDDEASVRNVLKQVLEEDGYMTKEATMGEEALECLKKEHFSLVITDIVMPGMTGIELLEKIKQLYPSTEVIIITSQASLDTAITAIRHGAYDYLFKPFEDISLISAAATRAVEKARLISLNQNLLEELEKEKEELERRVAERTVKLKKINTQLMQEITERISAQDAAEAANRAKSDFLASMSHEIRSPMTAVIGMTDLLLETPLDFNQKRFLGAIQSSGENLLQLINDILDLSKVEAGQIELEKTPFDLMEVIKNTCEAQAFHAQEKNVELVWWVRPEVETHLLGDSVRLGQILTNLIGNAVKFTKKGEVFIEVKRQEISGQTKAESVNSGYKQEATSTSELMFSVTDTGIGIPPDKRDIVFDRFTQADSSTTRKYGGTGLGLAISRRLTELMEGSIWYESKVGQGSTFYLTARFEVQSDKKYVQTPEADITNVKTLIIDDNATNRMVLSEMVSRWGALVTEKEDGKQGLAEIRRANDAGDPYGLILLDSRMPGLDGFQVAESIKEGPVLSDPVIMMLNLEDRKSGVKRGRELGINNFLLKPIKWSDLKQKVEGVQGRKKTAAHKQPGQVKPAVKQYLTPLNILLAEDHEQIRRLIKSFLNKTPYKLDTAEDGEIAVKKFKAHKYDLVIMDIDMPVMDGYTATTEIRKWEAQNRKDETPIVVLSAHALTEHRQKSLEVGCNAHLAKPIKKEDLLAAIRQYQTKR
jgi:CheY-like chemotaxis protein